MGTSKQNYSDLYFNSSKTCCSIDNYRDHAIPFFIDSNILPINFLYFYNTSCLMHDIINGKSPLNITELFTKIDAIHNYDTRSASRNNLYQFHSKLSIALKTFSSTGVKVWNSLPSSMRSLSKSLFKNKCKSLLMETLKSCDDYVDVAHIVQILSERQCTNLSFS